MKKQNRWIKKKRQIVSYFFVDREGGNYEK